MLMSAKYICQNLCDSGLVAGVGHVSRDRYVKLMGVHALGIPGTFSPPLRASDSHMLLCTCVTHVQRCMPGSLTSGFLWSRWQGKYSQHFRRMRNPHFYVSGKRFISALPFRFVDCAFFSYSSTAVRAVFTTVKYTFWYIYPHGTI